MLLDEFTLLLELLALLFAGSLLTELLPVAFSLLTELLELLFVGSLLTDELGLSFIRDTELSFAGSFVAFELEFILFPLSLISVLPFEILVAFEPLLSSAREVAAEELSFILLAFVVEGVLTVVVPLLLPLLLPLMKRPLPPL